MIESNSYKEDNNNKTEVESSQEKNTATNPENNIGESTEINAGKVKEDIEIHKTGNKEETPKRAKKLKMTNKKEIIKTDKKNKIVSKNDKKIKKKPVFNPRRWGKHIPTYLEVIKLLPTNSLFLNIPNELKELEKHLPVSSIYGRRCWRNTYPKYIEPFMNTVIYSFDKQIFYISGVNVYKFKSEVLHLIIHEERVFFILEDCFYKYEKKIFIKFNEKIQHLCVNVNNELVLIKGKRICSKSFRKTLKLKSFIKRIFPTKESNKYYLLLENNNLIYFDGEINYLFEIAPEIYRMQCINNDMIILTKDGLYVYYGDQKRGTFLKKKYFIKSWNIALFTANNKFIFINNVATNNLIIFSRTDLTKYVSLYFHATILNISILGNKIYILFYDSVKIIRMNNLYKLKKLEDLKEFSFFIGLFDPLNIPKGQSSMVTKGVKNTRGTISLEPNKLKTNMYMFSPLTKFFEELELIKPFKQVHNPRQLCLENINDKFHKYFKDEEKTVETREFVDATAEQKEIKDEVKKKIIKRKRGF